MRFSTAKILLSIMVTLAAATASAATTWNMATPYPDANFHTQNDLWFAKHVKEATNGQLIIRVHSNGSLIKHSQIKQAVQTGQVQIGEIFMSILSNQNAVFAADSVPFLATNYAQARKLWQVQEPLVKKLLAEQGAQLLYSVPWPPQGLYTEKPVDSLADLKGIKLRANNTEESKLARLIGATSTQVEVPDVPQAFSTGIVQAMITSPSTGVNTQAWDYVKHFYTINAWIPKNMVFVNKQALAALPESQRKAVLKWAKKAQARGWKVSQKVAKSKIVTLKQHGIDVEKPSDKLMSGFRNVGKQLTQDWLNRAGQQGQDIVAAYKKLQ
ncbi:MAG: TRAP transporter substrate-binding protein [Salinisphaera sp.]|jgi:TRAP-type C4-dicarboxylate transport system substrate-binding protein|nr:TRAP transporter substrate-binding protein [Salinisphaera sp.]